ncbi:MAG TPA: 50S ribosomal protein L18 [Candidatus Paceibacterota bacterium]
MISRIQRHKRVRAKIFGTKERPRLSVFRSNKYIFLQIIDDSIGKTIVGLRSSSPREAGKKIAVLAKEKKIDTIVFDRGGYLFKGKIKEVADGAREEGLKF